jgi:hypothetical protein
MPNREVLTLDVRFEKDTTKEYRKQYLIDRAFLVMDVKTCLGNPCLTIREHKTKIVYDNLVTLDTKTSLGKIEVYKYRKGGKDATK